MDELVEPRPLTPAGERIAAAAEDLFYRRGIRVTGVDAIAEAAGTTKKTLYDQFGSKDALVAVYLIRRARRWQAFLDAAIDQAEPGTARVLAVFDAIGDWSTKQTRGCAFVNAYAELGDAADPAVATVRAEKDWMRNRIAELVADAGVADAERVARVVHLLYEGALVSSAAGGDAAALGTARSAARDLLSR